MAQCILCKEFFPPGFTVPTGDNKEIKCVFCERERNFIEYFSSKDNEQKKITKKTIIKQYKQFMREIEENPNVNKLLYGEEGKEIWEE